MTAMIQENHASLGTEKRWEEAARRLRLLDVHRTASAVKNHWNRVGRVASRVDERQVSNPYKMQTGLQASSKIAARREKRKLAGAVAKEKTKKAARQYRKKETVRKEVNHRLR